MLSQFINQVMQYQFLQQALLVSIVVGIVCGVVGCFIVLRGMALMGDAISHAILPGVAISYMLDINYFYGAAVVGVLAALGITFVKQNSTIKGDSAIGIIFSAFFALGVLLVTKLQTATDLTSILFGNVLTVQPMDRYLTFIISGLVLLFVALFYKELKLTSFDPVMAEASGLPVKMIHYALMIMLTLVTVISLQTVGVILVVSLLITPASTAYLLTDRLPRMLAIAVLIGVFSTSTGLMISEAYNLPSGVVMVLVVTVIFLLVFFLAPKKGLVWQYLKKDKEQEQVKEQ